MKGNNKWEILGEEGIRAGVGEGGRGRNQRKFLDSAKRETKINKLFRLIKNYFHLS